MYGYQELIGGSLIFGALLTGVYIRIAALEKKKWEEMEREWEKSLEMYSPTKAKWKLMFFNKQALIS